jgi:lipoprotein-anchoring transpeptidase ErfK/SrfK
LSSVSGAALLLAVFGAASPVEAQFFNNYGGSDGPAFYPQSHFDGGSARRALHSSRRVSTHNPTSRQAALHDPSAKQKPEKKAAKPDLIPEGPLTLVVSIANQRVTVFDKDTPIMESPVSTGMPGHPTPTGIFSVIEKQRYHHSNIYSGAPMPFMQRITWSGIALHEGVVPRHAASHGCIRLPGAFATRLFHTTKVGVRVLVTNTPVKPAEFSHPRLFTPAPPLAAADPRDALASTLSATPTGSNIVATGEKATTAATPKTSVDRISDAFPAAGTGTVSSAASTDAKPSMPIIMTQFPAVPAPAAADPDKPLPAGPISVFISRKEGKLFVRKGFQPVFDAPVTIDRPDQTIGTHLFTAVSVKNDGSAMRWLEVSMLQQRRVVERTRRGVRETLEAIPAANPSEALDRITIPAETAARISEMLTPGASVIISDQGLGPETGRGTDFVVLTKYRS